MEKCSTTRGELMSPEENINFARFGKPFQEGLSQLILLDRYFCDQIREVLSINFFEYKFLQSFVEIIFNYRDKYIAHPTHAIIGSIVSSDFKESEVVVKQLKDFLLRISESQFKVDGAEYIKEKALDFCRKQKVKEAMIKSIDLLEQSSFDDIANTMKEALQLGSSVQDGRQYIEDFEKRYEENPRFPVSSGEKILDDITQGGPIGIGEQGTIIGATGRGKSQWMCKLSGEALKLGKKCFFITHELNADVIELRHDAFLTGIPINDLKVNKTIVYDEILKYKGRLYTKYMPGKKNTIITVRNEIDKLCQKGFVPDIIFEDSIENLSPLRHYKERRFELQAIYEEYREILNEFKMLGWTTSQANRTGAKADIITIEDIAEAYSKCFSSDFIMGFSRTDEERRMNSGKIMIGKSRSGPAGDCFPCYVDLSRVLINVLPLDSISNEEVKNNLKNEAESLREKYRQFKNDKRNKADDEI